MIKGMTGFGSIPLSVGGIKGVIEVKSQNHRYFDLVYYLPIGFAAKENRIKQIVNKGIQRGRVTISIKITDRPLQHLSFNKVAVKEYLKYAKVIKKEFGLENNLTLSDFIRLPGIVESKDSVLPVDKIWPSLERSLIKSLDSLVQMREREGRSLKADVSKVLAGMLSQLRTIKARSRAILKQKKKDLGLDEFSSFQKGSDINEEITRLTHYILEFKLLLKSKATVGKKLDFVAQEMQRETNTIGSKLQDKIVSNAVITLKSKIEKLREQAQNIE